MRRNDRQPTTSRRAGVGLAVVVAGLVGLAAPGAALGSNDSCTQTLSNAGTASGGSVRDVMCGTSGNDTLLGRGGNDELRGFAGEDILNGGIGDDELLGSGGRDELDGESGSDTLNGSSGDDTLLGGTGNDVITGGTGDDIHKGEDGNDTLVTRDGTLDLLTNCGAGTDSLDMDLIDAGILPGGLISSLTSCEQVTIGAVNEGPNVAISPRSRRVRSDGSTFVRVRCPPSLPIRCKGTLKLQLATRRSLRRKAPRTRYSIRAGKSKRIRVRLSRRDRRTLRRARGVVTSVEKGQHGKKTTIQTVKLRARR
jgi:hypothetical protein